MLSPGELSRGRVNALANAGTIYAMIRQLNTLAANGDQAEAIKRLADLDGVLADEAKAINTLLVSEYQTAKAADRTHVTVRRFFPGPPAEHPDAANDKGHQSSS